MVSWIFLIPIALSGLEVSEGGVNFCVYSTTGRGTTKGECCGRFGWVRRKYVRACSIYPFMERSTIRFL